MSGPAGPVGDGRSRRAGPLSRTAWDFEATPHCARSRKGPITVGRLVVALSRRPPFWARTLEFLSFAVVLLRSSRRRPLRKVATVLRCSGGGLSHGEVLSTGVDRYPRCQDVDGTGHRARPLHYTPLGYSGGEMDDMTPDSYSAKDSATAVAPSSASLVLTSVETINEYAWAS